MTISSIVFSVVLLNSYFAYLAEKRNIDEFLGARLKQIVTSASLHLSSNDHLEVYASYLGQEEKPSSIPAFKRLQRDLQEIQKSHELKTDVYTFVVPEWAEEQMIFIGMASTTPYTGNAIPMTKVVKEMIKKKKAVYSHIYSTEAGQWISAVTPLFNDKNELIGGVSIDYNANDELAIAKQALIERILFKVAFSTFLSILFGSILGHNFSRPLVSLSRLSNKVRQGHYEDDASISKSEDEFGVLARNFSKMVEKLRENESVVSAYTNDLEGLVEKRTNNLKELNKELHDKIEQVENYQRSLVQSEKLASIGQIAAGVGHEINNPLMIISGHTELSKRKLDKQGHLSPEQTEQLFNVIFSSIKRMSLIIDNLKIFSRKEVETNQPISVNSCVHSSFELIQSIFSAEGVGLKYNLSEEDSFVIGNHPEFQQVIMNLLNNAKHATEGKEKRSIKIKTKVCEKRENVLLKITDNGKGMSQEVQDRIFDPFFTTKPAGEGTGLGLGICIEIIHRMNGAIEVESTLGEGTTFIITFPIEHINTQEPTQTKEMAQQLTSTNIRKSAGHVLLVEDEDDIREIAEDCLTDFGYIVKSFDNAIDALTSYREESYDIVVTDYNMPHMNGESLAKAIRQSEKPEVPILLVSGEVDAEKYALAKEPESGLFTFDAVLAKPWLIEDFEELMNNAQKKVQKQKKVA